MPFFAACVLCYVMIFYPASSVLRVNCYQRRVLRRVLRGPSVFNSPIWTRELLMQHLPTRQPPSWFIDIVLKLGAQLNIDCHFLSLWYDSVVIRTVTNALPLHYQSVALNALSNLINSWILKL